MMRLVYTSVSLAIHVSVFYGFLNSRYGTAYLLFFSCIRKDESVMNNLTTDLLTVLVLAVGLSMDAFAVAICKGLALKKCTLKNAGIVGVWFGTFQGVMPFIGWVLGVQFARYIENIAPWVAFVLLAIIGGNMIREALGGEEEEEETDTLEAKEMFLMAVATSIDALAIGITFAMVPVAILPGAAGGVMNTLLACIIICITTCVLSMGGVKLGNVFGTKYKSKAELAGGIILILLGLKILLEHFGIL